MLPSAASRASVIFPSPGISPSAMSAAAAPPDEENIFGVGADETFFSSIEALVASPPPSSSHGASPDLGWPSSGAARAANDNLSANAGLAFDSSRAAGGAVPPLLAPPPTASGHGLGPPRPLLPPGGSTGGAGAMAPVGMPATGTPSPSVPAAPRAKKNTGSSKSRAKGGGIRQKRSKSNASTAAARREAGLEDGEPDKMVCLLAVGSKAPQLVRAGAGTSSGDGGGNNDSCTGAASLDETVKMLTVEMGRNGRELETEHVDTGQRAVLQVKALARCDMRFGMVVLEVEESLVAAAEIAGELRAANRTTPIVAIAPPQLLKATLPPLARKYFNEILQLPVSAAKVRGLATRWLLQPPSCAGAAATSGMVGEPVDRGPMAWSTEARHAGSSSTSAVGAAGAITTTTTLVSPSLPPGAAPLQQQDGYAPSSGASCGPVSGAEGRTLLASSRATEALATPRAAMPSSPSSSALPLISRESERLPPPATGRVFGGGEEDRASPCRLFDQYFERQNAEMEAREYDFMFRHGTIVLRVEEDELGETTSEVFSACEYATAHFGSITGKPLESMFEFPATNEKTARRILEHIKKSDTDSMCSYINLKSEVRWMTSSFVSVRSLSKRPERGPGREQRLPPWYVILKICLPSTLGLIKEPELLENMYSKKAAEADKKATPPKKGGRKAAPKRSAKQAKLSSADVDNHEDGVVGGPSK